MTETSTQYRQGGKVKDDDRDSVASREYTTDKSTLSQENDRVKKKRKRSPNSIKNLVRYVPPDGDNEVFSKARISFTDTSLQNLAKLATRFEGNRSWAVRAAIAMALEQFESAEHVTES
jgi:phosphoenolpyruvate-protein kinase (PTS system EI component)